MLSFQYLSGKNEQNSLEYTRAMIYMEHQGKKKSDIIDGYDNEDDENYDENEDEEEVNYADIDDQKSIDTNII